MLLNQVNQLSILDQTHNYDIKINQLTADLNQANIEIKKLKNKLFLKENNNESKTSLRNFRIDHNNGNYAEENRIGPRTQFKNSYDWKITENFSSNKFINEEPTKLNRVASPYRIGISQDFNDKSNFEQTQNYNNINNDHYKNFNEYSSKLYNLKPIGSLKNDKSLNQLDEGTLEFYRP
jgi:hypothetical protein